MLGLWDNVFRSYAHEIINGTELVVSDEVFRITELSFHKYAKNHEDPWVYGLPDQARSNHWLFYYREECINQPMVEMTFGSASKKISAGILIRGMQKKSKSAYRRAICGPVNVAHEIMDRLGAKTIDELSVLRNSTVSNKNSKLHLRKNTDRYLPKVIFESPRPNLYWAKNKSPIDVKTYYRLAPYRFFSSPEHTYQHEIKNSKAPELLELALCLSGKASIVGVKKADEVLSYFHSGQSLKLTHFEKLTTLTGEDECQLMGAWLNHCVRDK